METKKMLESLKSEYYVKYFNQFIRKDWWDRTSGNEAKHNLLAAIPVLIITQDYLIDNNLKSLYVQKLAGNYNYIPCQLKTNSTKTPTQDHIVGVKRIGDIVWDSIKEKSLKIDNHKDWIYDNLFLWGRVDMTRDEHKYKVAHHPSTLLKNLNFNHYKNPLKKVIIRKIKQKLREFKKV
ncbi:hypothetical protein N8304_00035 [Flavobacteriaceae bacterium]|nr:hypothetical protein [Flavobacteriaceae bacterium]